MDLTAASESLVAVPEDETTVGVSNEETASDQVTCEEAAPELELAPETPAESEIEPEIEP